MNPATRLHDNKCLPSNPMITLQLIVTILLSSQSAESSFPAVATPNVPHRHDGPTTHDLIPPLFFFVLLPGCSQRSAPDVLRWWWASKQPREEHDRLRNSGALLCKCLLARVLDSYETVCFLVPSISTFMLEIKKTRVPKCLVQLST